MYNKKQISKDNTDLCYILTYINLDKKEIPLSDVFDLKINKCVLMIFFHVLNLL